MRFSLDSLVPSHFASVEELFRFSETESVWTPSVAGRAAIPHLCSTQIQVYLNQAAPIYSSVMQWDKRLERQDVSCYKWAAMQIESQDDVEPPQLSRRFLSFLDRDFPDFLDRKKGGAHSFISSLSRFYSYAFFFWGVGEEGVVKYSVYCKKVQNVNEMRDRTVTVADCFTSEMLPHT
jgi:hypothetical protein